MGEGCILEREELERVKRTGRIGEMGETMQGARRGGARRVERIW